MTMRDLNTTSVNCIVTVSLPVPCAPQRVRYVGDSASGALSWDASVFAARYAVYDVSGDARVELCNTTELYCQVTNFDPNATEVTASNAGGESIPNREITGQRTTIRVVEWSEQNRWQILLILYYVITISFLKIQFLTFVAIISQLPQVNYLFAEEEVCRPVKSTATWITVSVAL